MNVHDALLILGVSMCAAQEQFEREKKEMIDKLKTFGNWALGKVGLSIDNFKLEQNPETGAYNISFQNNSAN